MSLTFEEENIP